MLFGNSTAMSINILEQKHRQDVKIPLNKSTIMSINILEQKHHQDV